MLKRIVWLVAFCAVGVPAFAGLTDFDAAASLSSRGLLLTLLIVFAAGVLVSFTPCVYPMIPITLSIIGARSANQRPLQGFLRSFVFVLGLATVYSLLGYAGAKSGKLLGFLLQNKWFLGFLLVFFLAMGLSMLGLFEIQMPPALASRLQGKANRGGFVGAFLLGMITGVIASPCGSPVLFSILTLATQSGQELVGISLLFFYALGIGLLFMLLGTFPAFLKVMPKSGDWMEDIRIFLGALLIAVAVGYYGALLFPVAVYRGVVVISAVLGALFLLRLGNRRSHLPVLQRFWQGLALVLTLIAGYVVGISQPLLTQTGGALSAQSAAQLPPPQAAHISALAQDSSTTTGVTASPTDATAARGGQELASSTAGPTGQSAEEWLTDEATALARGQAEGRPVMIDFGAEWCAACKELERKTFPHPDVARELSRFIKVKVDMTEENETNSALAQKYGAMSLPTIIFIAPDGRVLSDLTLRKFEAPDLFLERLRKVREAEAKTP